MYNNEFFGVSLNLNRIKNLNLSGESYVFIDISKKQTFARIDYNVILLPKESA